MGLLYQLAQMLGEARKAADTPFVADWRSLLGLVCVVLVGSVANTAGVGGGAVFVPLFQALVGFPLKESTALSQALITAGSVVSVLLNLFSASPVDPSKPLIDFPLVLLLLPMLLVGVGIGVLLNVILPSYLISVLLFVLMCLLITQSLAKGIRMWILETRLQQMLQHELPCKGASHDEAFSGVGSPASHEADESVHLLCATIDEEQPPASPPLPPQGEAERGVAVAAAAAAAAAQTAPPLRGQAASAEGQQCEHDGQQGGAEAAAPVTPSRQRRPPRPRPPPASFRPSAEALRRLPAGGGTASGGGGVDATWVTRRNAWLTRFLHACDEHGSEALPLAAFPVPPMPLTQPQQRREGGGQGVAGPRLGKCTSARVVTGGSVRYQAAAKPLYEPLLSPEDSAAARVPHGRKKMLPPEQWDLTSGKSDAELLDALLADAAVAGGALAGARGAAAEGRAVGRGRRQPSVSGQEPALPSGNATVLVSFRPAGKAGTGGKEAESCEGERDVEAPPPGPLPVGTACRRSDEPEAEALSPALSSSAPVVSPRPHPRLPWGILAALGACWALYVGLQLAQRATTRCSPPWWALFAAQSLLLPSFSACAMAAARRRAARLRRAASAEPVPGGQEEGVCGSGHGGGECGHGGCSPGGNPEKPVEDRLGQLDLQQFLTYQALALTAGLIGGLLGLGGGMVIGPLLLEMGVHPQVSSATSSMCVLFSSSTALISVAALGYLNTQHAVVFSGASMVASVLGLVVIGGLIRRTGRVSLAVLSLSLVMLLGGAAVGGIGITVVMDAIRNGEGGFHSMCPKSQ